jgi:hypothetical protein
VIERERKRERELYRGSDRERERERVIEREWQRERNRDRERDRERKCRVSSQRIFLFTTFLFFCTQITSFLVRKKKLFFLQLDLVAFRFCHKLNNAQICM